jgi:VWFA-related protein
LFPQKTTLKNCGFGFLLLLLALVMREHPVGAAGFATKLLRIDPVNFPVVDVTLKVFTQEPTTLAKDNFLLSEDGNAVASFSIRAQRSTQFVLLALDRSSSIEAQMPQVKRAAGLFIETIPERVKTGILSFGSDVEVNHSFSNDVPALLAAVQKIRPYGGTCLYDAIWEGVKALNQVGRKTDIRTIVLLTDGKDSNPRGTAAMSIKGLEEVIEAARRADVTVFTIGLGADIDKTVLETVARMTGGAAIQAQNTDQLQAVYQKFGNRLRLEQYLTLAYQTPNPAEDGSTRQVGVKSEWQGLQDQGSGTYQAPLPAPPKAAVATKEEFQEGTYVGDKLDVELFQPRKIDHQFSFADASLQEAMNSLIAATNTRFDLIVNETNKNLGPLFAEWDQKVAEKEMSALAGIREQAHTWINYAAENLRSEFSQFEENARAIIAADPDTRQHHPHSFGLNSINHALRFALSAEIHALTFKMSANNHSNTFRKSATEHRNHFGRKATEYRNEQDERRRMREEND